MNKIIPNLWFDTEAEEAANFYVSVFKNSRIIKTLYYGEAGKEITKKEPGSVLTVDFELDGQRFTALNGGPALKFNEAISFLVDCETQEEIDDLWSKLSADPASEQCGWLKDKYGMSWQIVPRILDEMMSSGDYDKKEKATAAMLKMKKLDIAQLKEAVGETE